MCGRFSRHEPLIRWAEALGTGADERLRADLAARDDAPRYNIAPGTKAWIVGFDIHGDVGFTEHKWAYPTSRGNRINVRSETAHVVPEYRGDFDARRCVVLADGFYEPRGPKSEKVRPWYYFAQPDGAPIFIGAIAKEEGFSILTRAPVKPVALVHDRTPVFIPADRVLEWLDPEVDGRNALLKFAPAAYGEQLVGWRVGDGAKWPVNEGPALIEPLQAEAGQLTRWG